MRCGRSTPARSSSRPPTRCRRVPCSPRTGAARCSGGRRSATRSSSRTTTTASTATTASRSARSRGSTPSGWRISARPARRWRRRCGWGGSSCRRGWPPRGAGPRAGRAAGRPRSISWRWPASSRAASWARPPRGGDGGSPTLDQLALADFVERGELDRHLRRARLRYRRRRDALVAAVGEAFPDVRVRGVAAGLHVVAELPRAVDERTLRRRARSRGADLVALRHAGSTLLVLGYANVPEAAAERAVAVLRDVYDEGAP